MVKLYQINKLCFKVSVKSTILERLDVVDTKLISTHAISGLTLGSFHQEQTSSNNGLILSEWTLYKYIGSTGTHINFLPFLNKMRWHVLLPEINFP